MNKRGNFSNRLGFIAATAGAAVGLGNIWGFPYEVSQGGGGAFLFIYLFFCFTICIPVMLTELAIGRKTGRNAVGAFKALGFKNWKFAGLLGILSSILILSYYNVIAAWAFGYIFEIATFNFNIHHEFQSYTSDLFKVVSYAIIFMALTSFFVSKGVSGGIEKLAKVLMPALIIMIISVSIYAMTLPNAIQGLEFYIIPDFNEVTLSTVFNAMGQAFFSLSLGMGALITYGSYVSKKENLVKSAVIVTLADVGIAFLAGLMIFPLLGFMSEGHLDNVANGPDLIFVSLPEIFAEIGGSTGAFIGAFFFLLLCFAALTSTVSMMEVPVAFLVDEFNITRKKAVLTTALVVFSTGIPSLLGNGYSDQLTSFVKYIGSDQPISFLTFVINLANDTLLPLVGLLITLFAAYAWKKANLDQELAIGSDYKASFLQRYMTIALKYILPIVLTTILIMKLLVTFFGV
ncbi:sodium-dependent transporter [Ekhidna sp.]|uniref:sodium-dependent transporter n=1 Tax=Ekhidna sp. TaxID=2608089 RepID=UPI003298C0F9